LIAELIVPKLRGLEQLIPILQLQGVSGRTTNPPNTNCNTTYVSTTPEHAIFDCTTKSATLPGSLKNSRCLLVH
jgi:hypothetical protein